MKSQLTGKDPEAGKDWGQGEKGMTEDDITDSVDMSLSKLREIAKVKEDWHEVTKNWTQLSDWTTLELASHLQLIQAHF